MHDGIELVIASLAVLRAKRASLSSLRNALIEFNSQNAEEFLSKFAIRRLDINNFWEEASRDIENGLKHNIVPILIGTPRYPKTLAQISDAPPILFTRGNATALNVLPGISVVGTRKATKHGITIAQRISTYIGDLGFPVVSGLALGIDAAAHEGALTTSAPTIAVLAHGLEKATPKANAHLAERILDYGGMWVSEHPFGTIARPEYFVQRNRIQVGLSCASVIVEGEERSGSMTQAEFCIRNRRFLAAVLPENMSDVSTQYQLPKMLVEHRGALPIRSKDDYSLLISAAEKTRNELLKT